MRHSLRTCFLHGSPSRTEEVHQDTWAARSAAHREMSQLLTQQEWAAVGWGLRGAAGVPLTFLPPGERKCVWFKLPLERTETQRQKDVFPAQPCAFTWRPRAALHPSVTVPAPPPHAPFTRDTSSPSQLSKSIPHTSRAIPLLGAPLQLSFSLTFEASNLAMTVQPASKQTPLPGTLRSSHQVLLLRCLVENFLKDTWEQILECLLNPPLLYPLFHVAFPRTL